MAGQVTVSVELSDGTSVEFIRNWSGGNPVYEGVSAVEAAKVAAEDCRKAIDATHGTLDKHTSPLYSHTGRMR